MTRATRFQTREQRLASEEHTLISSHAPRKLMSPSPLSSDVVPTKMELTNPRVSHDRPPPPASRRPPPASLPSRLRWCSIYLNMSGQMHNPLHSLHWLLDRTCGQMLDPLHSLHCLLRLWCSQMLDPLHSLQTLLRRWCSQMLDPLHSLHCLLSRWCSQMLDPPHSLQTLLWRWCSQMPDPPHSLHVLLRRLWAQMLATPFASFVLSFGPSPIAVSPTAVFMPGDSRYLACIKPPGKVGSDGFSFCRLPCTGLPQLLMSCALV